MNYNPTSLTLWYSRLKKTTNIWTLDLLRKSLMACSVGTLTAFRDETPQQFTLVCLIIYWYRSLSYISTPLLCNISFTQFALAMDPRIRSRFCTLCKLPLDHEIVKKLDIIFTRLAINPNQYEVLRLLLNISELTDAWCHLWANVSIPNPISTRGIRLSSLLY